MTRQREKSSGFSSVGVSSVSCCLAASADVWGIFWGTSGVPTAAVSPGRLAPSFTACLNEAGIAITWCFTHGNSTRTLRYKPDGTIVSSVQQPDSLTQHIDVDRYDESANVVNVSVYAANGFTHDHRPQRPRAVGPRVRQARGRRPGVWAVECHACLAAQTPPRPQLGCACSANLWHCGNCFTVTDYSANRRRCTVVPASVAGVGRGSSLGEDRGHGQSSALVRGPSRLRRRHGPPHGRATQEPLRRHGLGPAKTPSPRPHPSLQPRSPRRTCLLRWCQRGVGAQCGERLWPKGKSGSSHTESALHPRSGKDRR